LYDFKQKKFIDTEHPNYTKDKISVQKNGMWLQYVEREFQTEELCRLAVLQNGRALKYVIKQTDEICKLAVKEFGLDLDLCIQTQSGQLIYFNK
jgi:hypothetical protein